VKPDDLCELYVICDFVQENWIYTINNTQGLVYKSNYIWISDLINVLRETETYYSAVHYPARPVVVLGEETLVRNLLECNPNLQEYYRIYVTDWCNDVSNIQSHLTCPPQNLLYLLVTHEPIEAKKTMIGAGYAYGDDFYFYDESNKKWADMLEETIKSEQCLSISCSIDNNLWLPSIIHINGDITCCCGRIKERLGNIHFTNFEYICNSPTAKILQLSTINRTYCFCSENCKRAQVSSNTKLKRNDPVYPHINTFIIAPSYIRACNCYCRSCRDELITKDTQPSVLIIHEEFLKAIPMMKGVGHADGELLFSKLGREILETDPSDTISITTNGMLLNEKNWNYLLNLYENISITISVDGGTKDTFEFLRRGAKWETLIKNLRLAGEMRKADKIKQFSIGCVVQVSNFRELDAIVYLGREVGTDFICFGRLVDSATFVGDELLKHDVQDPLNPDYIEFVRSIATNPIFQEEDISFEGIYNILKIAELLSNGFKAYFDLTVDYKELEEKYINVLQENKELVSTIDEIHKSNTWQVGKKIQRAYRFFIPSKTRIKE